MRWGHGTTDICSFAWVEGEWSRFGAGLLLGVRGWGSVDGYLLVSYAESFNPSIAPPYSISQKWGEGETTIVIKWVREAQMSQAEGR
jgi:hypothetical protein